MKLLLLFLLVSAVQLNCVFGQLYETIDRFFIPGFPWAPPPNWQNIPSVEINSREHGVRPGRRPTSCSCGVANRAPGSRIVGGRVYNRHEYPFIAGLVHLSPYRPFCGGTIISQYHVVTAAHCTADIVGQAPLHVVLGDYDRTMGLRADDVIKPVASIAQHPQYHPELLINDIAILILKDPIQFNSKISPICMPLGPMNLVGKYIRVIGWGARQAGGPMTAKPQKVDLRVVDGVTCAAAWRGMVQPNSPHICTHSKKKTACQGDSGGPVIYIDPDTNRYTLVGAVSFGAQCTDDKPSVQTDVTKHLPWIRSIIAANKPAVTCG